MFTRIFGIFIGIAVIAFIIYFLLTSSQSLSPSTSHIQIVAAENFYGDIAEQLGGSHVVVKSILSDPNADPHEYESSVPDAVAVANASLIIENGLSYDSWMDKLVNASPNNKRTVLIMGNIAPHKLPDNPHVWYGIDNVTSFAASITSHLKKIDPQNSKEYDQNLQTFLLSLSPIKDKINDIKAKFANTPVGLTETIYLYQSNPEGLSVLTPFDFEKAVAEGNDPLASSVSLANTQVIQKQIKILIVNSQTITPITTNLENEAKEQHIPVVFVSETMPKNTSYQDWMLQQLDTLESSLSSQ